jgi:6-phosphogluconolactonase
MTVTLEVVPDPAAVCAEMLVETAAAGGDIVLTGGSTPRAAYEQAAQAPGDWSGATLWFGDDRCVPPDHEDSNYAMARQALLDPLRERVGDAGSPAVMRIPGELGPHQAADAYEHELRSAGPPHFDLLLLGLGPDGHTASLFPDQESLHERSRLAVGVEHASLAPFVPRVTMTLPALALGRRIVFLVTGESKANAVAAAFGPGAKPEAHVPASLLPPLAEHITVLLDSAAAGALA